MHLIVPQKLLPCGVLEPVFHELMAGSLFDRRAKHRFRKPYDALLDAFGSKIGSVLRLRVLKSIRAIRIFRSLRIFRGLRLLVSPGRTGLPRFPSILKASQNRLFEGRAPPFRTCSKVNNLRQPPKRGARIPPAAPRCPQEGLPMLPTKPMLVDGPSGLDDDDRRPSARQSAAGRGG